MPQNWLEAINARNERLAELGAVSFYTPEEIDWMLASERRAEREACAKVAEAMPEVMLHIWDRPGSPPGNGLRQTTGKDIASAIRARIETT